MRDGVEAFKEIVIAFLSLILLSVGIFLCCWLIEEDEEKDNPEKEEEDNPEGLVVDRK